MGVLDTFLMNNENISKGFEVIRKGYKYTVAYDSENRLVAYTVGEDIGQQLMEKYLEGKDFQISDLVVRDEYHKNKDRFVQKNSDYQLCILDKEVLLKKDINLIMTLQDIKPDKRNKRMIGLDKYTRL